ncbi:Ger(x)C family spore germination protein [Anaerobacillus isosaccharinicus]|uniref:Ger(X)C family spore germination protein n=1 Tax=Anaerobacillus isosaccharinicus TaxID=1532552 RepID=A0A1S2KW59_9BACI|nr:Ger(x)C family spore germination protein [Anaerobacillus isosaccharinicus]MBA5585329.1 Ger(x)C family spore germination protein [Anaerobacillus isosaccharinicus]QOY36345.1 Ger(x)C family spore germination protein [Anaerobacillus isosaccharinicus]
MVRIVLVALVSLLLLTSCWDRKEIEELSIVMALAIDPLEEEELEKYEGQFKRETGKEPEQLFKTTYQIVIPSTITEGRQTEEKAYFNVSSVGRTNFKIVRNIAARRSRRLNFEHLKLIIINEKIARTGTIGKMVDLYIRDHEMRRRTLMYVSKGKAEEVLEKKLPLEMMPALSMKMIQENYPAHQGLPFPVEIGELGGAVIGEKSYIIPRITAKEGKDLIIAGAGVFLGKTNELIGWLGEEDLEGYNYILGQAENAIIEVRFKENLFVYELDGMDTEIDYMRKNETDHFQIRIKTEGTFVENWLEGVEIGDQATIEELEKALEEEIKFVTEKIVKKMQEEFHADIFKLYISVKKKNYPYWKKIEDQWDGKDGYFSKAVINIDVKAKIRHYMTKERLS